MRKPFAPVALALLAAVGARYLARGPARTDRADSDPLALGTEPCGRACGSERWQVKTLSDGGRSRVTLMPIRTTVAALAALDPSTARLEAGRLAPVELTTYQVDAYLAGWDNEADGDIHLILADLVDQHVTLIAEIPNPECAGACASGLAGAYARVRMDLVKALGRPNPTDQPLIVRVTGVGFFDRPHGQIGAAPNFVELHPVLALEVR